MVKKLISVKKPKKQVTFWIDDDDREWFAVMAKETNKTKSQILKELVALYRGSKNV